MFENNVSLNTIKPFILRPFIVSCISILAILSIVNVTTAPGSLNDVKSGIAFVFVICLFIVTTYSYKYFIWLYVGGAILQGFSFLVPPEAIEQKFFFSYFFLNWGATKVYLTDLFLLIAFIVLVLQLLLPNKGLRSKLFNSWLSRCIALFIVIGCFICLMSIQKYGKSALGEARSVWYVILFFVSARYFNSYDKIIDFFRFFVFITIVRTGFNFITVFISPAYLSYIRPFGSNADAAYCALSFLLIITLGERIIKNAHVRKTTLFWLGIFPILITSRSTLLCLLVTLSVYALFAKQISVKKIIISAAVIITILSTSVYLIVSIPQLNDLIFSRFLTLIDNYQDDPTGNWRLLGWLFALQSIKENPLLGIGFGGYAERFIDGQWITVSLHSAYLDYLYSIGLFGLLPFVGVLLLSISSLIKTFANELNNNRVFAISLLLVIIFYMMFIGLNAEMSYALSGTILWIFLGMVPYITNNELISMEQMVQYEKS